MTEIAVHRAHMQHLIKCYMRTALMDTAYRMPISFKVSRIRALSHIDKDTLSRKQAS